MFEDYLTTAVGEGEIVTEIRVPTLRRLGLELPEVHPPRRGLGDGRRPARWSRRRATAPCEDVRIALTNMGSTPLRATAAEDALRGKGARRSIAAAAEQAAEGTDPPGDLNATPDYKRHLARVLTRRALEEAAGLTRHRGPDIAGRGRRGARRASATSPTARWPPRCSWPPSWASRCWSRARPGVGKTEVAKALAAATGARLIRLQCHEGIDVHHALYDWDYSRQLLARARGRGRRRRGRAVLAALPAAPPAARGARGTTARSCCSSTRSTAPTTSSRRSCSSCSPTSRSRSPSSADDHGRRERPLVVLTSNRTRELHDALKRRCLYHWIDYPDPRARDGDRPHARAGRAEEAVVARVVDAVARLRGAELYKLPGRGGDDRVGAGARRARRPGRRRSTTRSASR